MSSTDSGRHKQQEERDQALAEHRKVNERAKAFLAGVPPRRVLVVEDDVDVAALTVTLLEGQGLQVDVAPTCLEARALLEREVYGLVVLDLGLPDCDGWEIAVSVRRGIPVALTSSIVPREGVAALLERTRAQAVVDVADTEAFLAAVRRLLP